MRRCCGREFTQVHIAQLAGLIADNPQATRAQLSRLACRLLDWRKADGGLKEMSCRVAMLRLHREGLIRLPPPRNRQGSSRVEHTLLSAPQEPLKRPAHELEGLHAGVGAQPARLVLVERVHRPLPLPGPQAPAGSPDALLRLLAGPHPGLVLGFGAAAWKTAPRDRFIGWLPGERESNLHLIANNARFLILPWVESKNLASKVLAMAARRLPADWLERYAYRPVLLETFVDDERFTGACYKAANWIRVGRTQGRGKLDRRHEAKLPAMSGVNYFSLQGILIVAQHCKERLALSAHQDLQTHIKVPLKTDQRLQLLTLWHGFTKCVHNGNVFSMIDHVVAGKDQDYGYDFLNRLTDASSPGGLWSHGYDGYGNLHSRTSSGSGLGSMSLSISASNNRITGAGYSYNSAGNQTGSPGRSHQWDGQGRLRSVDHGATASYDYDAEDRRVKKSAGEQTRLYFHDKDGNAVWEHLVGAPYPWETFNHYFQGRLTVVNSAAANAAPLWVHSDHLGSPRLKTDASGAEFSRDWHFPFGASLMPSNDGVKLQFTGKEHDAETGLDYFGARHYDSVTGRFIRPDFEEGQPRAISHARLDNPQTWNKYAYTVNNPVRFIDPDGHCTDPLTCAFAGGVGGSVVPGPGNVVGAVVGALVGTAIIVAAILVVDTLTDEDPSGTSSDEPNGSGEDSAEDRSKSAEDMGEELADEIGKNSVPFETESKSGRIDLRGRSHFDKKSGRQIDTPHVQVREKSVGPNGKVSASRKTETIRPATKNDTRTARKLVERRKEN